MADSGIKNVVIKKADLPYAGLVDVGYAVRFKIVSRTQNRESHWSPIYILPTSPLGTATAKTIVDVDNKIIQIIWTPPEDLITIGMYNVYVQWMGDDLEAVYPVKQVAAGQPGTGVTLMYGFTSPGVEATKFRYIITLGTGISEINTAAVVYESDEISLVV